MQRLNRPGLWIAALGAVGAAWVVIHIDEPAARVVPALLLIFVLPGYALSAALLPKRGLAWDRAPLTLGLSIVVTGLGSLAAYRASETLDTRLWAVLPATVTVGACGVALARSPGAAKHRRTRDLVRQLSPFGLLAAAAVVFVAADAVVLARSPVTTGVNGYSSLWIKRGESAAGRVELGVSSSEVRPATYRVVVRSASGVVFHRRLELDPSQTWHGLVADVPAGEVLSADLYKDGNAKTPYRRVQLKEAVASRGQAHAE
jgi:uncharacterized membrane protein